MDAKKGSAAHADNLRQRAERLVRLTRHDIATMPVEDVQKLVHELQVYQIELDMQNEQLRQTQRKLEESRDQYSDLYDFAPVGYLTLDPQGVVQEANLTAAAMIGIERGLLPGRSLARTVATCDRDRFRSHMKAVFAGNARQACELELVRKDGMSLCARLDSIRASSRNGQTPGCHMTISDVTERRHAELERHRLEAKIQEAQKLESLGVLAGGIAHDFNNLLTGILGFASLAQTQVPTDSPAQDGLQHIVRAVERAAELVRQMLAYAGKGGCAIAPIDLSQLASEMLDLLQASLSKKAELRLDLPTGLPLIEADAAQVRQVFMNLLTNAAEALGDHVGANTLRTGVIAADQTYLAKTYLQDNPPEGIYVFVEVADTGCGMAEETALKIFEPFFTTKFTGRGLGLASVLGIVRAHHGAILLQSQPEHGTTFRVLFPAVQQTSLPIVPKKFPSIPVSAEHRQETATVLVADDEEPVRSVAKAVLRRSGFTVLTASDGWEALEVFRAHRDAIDAVLLDLTMPRLGGAEVLRDIRRERADVPVILSSGYDEQDALAHFPGAGLAGFIQKPYRADDLLVKVRQALDMATPAGSGT